jgi:hypothetical protein
VVLPIGFVQLRNRESQWLCAPFAGAMIKQIPMKQATFIAILLAFLMFLLVLAAAVVFLVMENREQDQALTVASTEQASLTGTREQLASDLAVRDAALDASGATREAFDNLFEQDRQQIAALEEQLSQQSASISQAEGALQEMAVQLFIFSPKDGANVPPAEPIELIVGAIAESGLESVTLTVNGEELERIPAEGSKHFTLRTEWTPPDEDEYVIGAVAQSGDGSMSVPAVVMVTSAYSSPEAREAALRQQVENDVTALRFPESVPEAGEPAPTTEPLSLLHQRLLTGRAESSNSEIADEILVMRSFDFLSSGAGYEEFITALTEQNLIGYSDPGATSPIIISSNDREGAYGRWLEIHALAHALQEERLALSQTDLEDMESDARVAVRALAEGDATFLQYLYVEDDFLSPAEKTALEEDLNSAAADVFSGMPAFLRNDYEFAYTAGLDFVKFLHDSNGYSAVNAAWEDLPQSSEQVIHPERYLSNDEPISLTLASLEDVLGEDWRLVEEDTFGEFYLREFLRQQLTGDVVEQAATGWGGDRYAVYSNESEATLLMMLRLAWDTPEDADEGAAAITSYLGNRFQAGGQLQPDNGLCWQNDDVFCFYRLDGDSLLVRAPSMRVASMAAAAQEANANG